MTTEIIKEQYGTYKLTEESEMIVWLELESVEGYSEFIQVPYLHESRESALESIAHTERKLKIIMMIHEHTTEMEGYSYYGSNPGVPVESYEVIAENILNEIDQNGI